MIDSIKNDCHSYWEWEEMTLTRREILEENNHGLIRAVRVILGAIGCGKKL